MGVPLALTCGYNTRDGSRWIMITDSKGDPLLTQTVLKKSRYCELNFLSNRYDLSFSVTIKPKDKTKVFSNDYDYLNWAEDFDLFFAGTSLKVIQDLEVNLRKVYVGN
jgi:hypothetical protein